MSIGDRIRQRRKDLGLTQEDLAKRMGYTSRTAISNVEKGGEDLTTTRIMKYAKALNCTPSYLMGWVDDPTSLMKELDINLDEVPKKTYKDIVLMTDEEKIVIECYRDLDKSQKEMVKRMIAFYEKFKELQEKRKGE